ncbi:MAG: amino acid permease, partial [Candidatus Omnitrophica bacterium]|nr:amino acid permease [Candidatus Omnitrophota bacterium]
IVGVGIFRTASSIAGHVHAPALILILWAFGGLLSLCGALCYAELAAMFPASGGDYVYISKSYGNFWGFLFGCTKLFIERTGTIAILGYVFAEHVRRVIPYNEIVLRWVASGAILALTAVNVVGIRWGTYTQNIFTVLKTVALCTLIAVGARAFLAHDTVLQNWTVPPITLDVVQAMGVALIFVLWTYGGWTEAAYVAEEVRDPTRNVPKAIVGGVILTTALYLLVNWSYLLMIPSGQLPSTPLVASSVMQSALGNAGAVFIAWMIACSAFGALNGYILTGARILYALGKDHALFGSLAEVHPAFHTPARALWMNAAIAIVLVCTKTFDQIMTYSTLVISVFFTMAVFGVIILRRTHRTQARPYRAWGYPLTPLLFCLTMIGFILDVCLKEPRESAFGFLLLGLCLPLYQWSRASTR